MACVFLLLFNCQTTGSMIKDTGPQFRFLTACSFKKAVVNNESIDPILVSERLDFVDHLL